MTLRDRIELSDRQERWLVHGLQALLVGILLLGVRRNNVGIVVNAGGSLAITFLPALLARTFDLRTDPGLTLLLTVAVAFHAAGTLGPYHTTSWWDLVAHVLSGVVVTGVGYAVLRGLDRHLDDLSLPQPYFAVVLFLFVLAVGVLWEAVEFGATRVSGLTGGQSVLVVFGPADIVTDLIFTAVGGGLAALWGLAHFRGLAASVSRALAR